MEPAFEFDMRVDDRGVVLYAFSGVFDLGACMEQQALARQRLFPDGFDPTRPVVADLRRFLPPRDNWVRQAHDLFGHLDRLGGPARRRCALIVGDNAQAELGTRFYIAFKSALRRPGDTRSFADFDDGYAWAAADLAEGTDAVMADQPTRPPGR